MTPDSTPTVVLAGDSITASGDWQTWLHGVRVVNLAVPGHTTADLRARIPDIEQCRPDVVAILIGTNDFGGLDRAPDAVAGDIVRIVERLRADLPGTRVLLQSIMPRDPVWTSRIQQVNATLASAAQRLGVGYLDTWPALARSDGSGLDPAYLLDDGFDVHLDGRGYRAWLAVLEPAIGRQLVATEA